MSKNAALKQRTAYLSIISNTTLVVLKLIVGIYVGAVSLISAFSPDAAALERARQAVPALAIS